MSHGDKRLYNYVVNTLGLSKDLVLDHVNKRIDDVLFSILKVKLNSSGFEKMILDRVTKCVRDGFPVSDATCYFYEKNSFDDFVKSAVRAEIEKKIQNEYSIQVHAVAKAPKGQKSHGFLKRPEEE